MRHGRPQMLGLAGMALSLVVSAGCKNREGPEGPEGVVTEAEANRFVKKAIRSSSEGVIVIPGRKAERMFELPRLHEVAQAMRRPAAVCFLNRAIETIQRKTVDGELTYVDVPEGQIKIRARIAPNGEVVRTEVLDTGFKDNGMEPCLLKVVSDQKWPPSKSGNVHFVDVVYWVSLGAQRGATEDRLRREQVSAGIKAKNCLEGRVDAGRYEVEGLNLIDRDGRTIINRIEPGPLPTAIASCVAQALKQVRLPRDADSFVRPISPMLEFAVEKDGTVGVKDEDWLALIHGEERALRAARRAELVDGDGAGSTREVSSGSIGNEAVTEEPSKRAPAPSPVDHQRKDPAKGGHKLDLTGPRLP